MDDDELKTQTPLLKERLKNGESLDDILPEAFATVREASVRTLEMRHFDVQLIGGIVLHQGKIAEMKTGEGKTLAATLPAYLNALTGRGVHIITVNDYLARRDTEWMGHIYKFLGLSVGCILHGLDDEERKAAYNSDITYGTNNEFGFDYLRDNMKFDKDSIVQGELNFAIVDEVDSILIDEARTPLIISGPIGFQYAAEITYPTPEGTSNGLLLLMGQISGIIFILGMDSFKAIETGSMTFPLTVLIGLMVLSLFFCLKLRDAKTLMGTK